MSFLCRRTPAAVILSLALLGSTPPAAAQEGVSGAVDLGYAPTYSWRGRMLDQRPVASGAALGRYASGRNVLAGGLWTGWTLGGKPAGADALGGTGIRPSELDLWGQYTRESTWADVSVGVIHYAFTEREDLAGTEAYLQVWPGSRRLPADVKGTVYVGLGQGSGTYAELDAGRVVPLVPIPTAPVAARLGISAGFSLDAGAAESSRGFSAEGPTHIVLSAILTVAPGTFAIHAGGRYQRSFEAARPSGGAPTLNGLRGEVGVTYSLGAR
jgi:hypothetical protein